MNVLVTGATGFIGKYLVEELIKHDYKVRILTRKKTNIFDKEVEVTVGDITKPETLNIAFNNIDAVFHNAAYAMDWGKKNEMYNINVEGTKNIAKICEKKGVNRVILTSSAGVYGFPNTDDLITEDSQKNPYNYYQKSKLLSENVLRNTNKLIVSIIRPPLVFGAGGKAVKILLSMIESRKMVFISNGNQHISLVHPEDVAQCLRLALEKDKEGDVFNVVSFICSIKDFINQIADEMNVERPTKHVPYFVAYLNAFFVEKIVKNDPSITRFRVKSLGTTRKISNEKAMKKLGFKPRYNLSSMVEDMVSWYKTSLR